MPLVLDGGDGGSIGLDDLVEALDANAFDVRDEASFAALAPWLARLGRNPDFLAELVVAELKERCDAQARTSTYGGQVFLLRPPNGRYLLRAAFWPARADPALRSSGPAAFFYNMPHDHNFPFLTYGYVGPGYHSDYYTYDPQAVSGVPGSPAGLRFVERARLEPGRVMLYRPGHDVHVQLPPDSFSVSLNILGQDPAQVWQDQYRFDVRRDVIAGGLTCAPSEALIALAVHAGNGRDLAEDFARSHPHPRMRATAFAALAGVDGPGVWERAAGDGHRFVSGTARAALERLAPERSGSAG
ncbi:transposase [Sphingomonas aracearum]|uniref:Transposase n=1 Tax=Sphingomonas aracearum TaxID=2283317 RepID=A0A369VZ88_9SPHN|nr:transposase [Sphingomonas aracearum]RDE07119.1 transposase [Sphingomonas aracearum]